MDITIVTTANSTEEGKALLVEFGFPFEKIKYRIMAKESMKAKERKRAKLAAQYKERRAILRKSQNEGNWEAMFKLQSFLKIQWE